MKSSAFQHIGIQVINEQYEVLSNFSGNFAPIYEYFLVNNFENKPEYPFLSGVDPYGNVFFNDRQVPKLINELKLLSKTDKDPELKDAINETVAYISTIDNLLYIKFLGD